MSTHETRMLVGSDDGGEFSVHVEPEGVDYRLRPKEGIMLTLVGPTVGVQYLELTHSPDALVITRPADTTVWATRADGTHNQIAGFKSNPFPWLDAGGQMTGQEVPPWTWPPTRRER